jgi:hypothetical protein
MVNSISSAQTSHANEAVKSAAPKAQPQQAQQKSASQPSDTVSLKSAGDTNHDGDSK